MIFPAFHINVANMSELKCWVSLSFVVKCLHPSVVSETIHVLLATIYVSDLQY